MNEKTTKTSKLNLFLENFAIYGLGGIISKLIPLIMLPLITRLMPNTSYFGISDLSNTAMQFGSALAVIGMYDAMYRMFFEKDEAVYKKNVCSTTIIFTGITSVLITILMITGKNFIAKYFFGDIKYSYLVYITALTTLISATNQIVAAPTRMQNKRGVYLIANTVGPFFSYAVSIPLILKGYFIIALPLGALISGAVLEASFWVINKEWFLGGHFDKTLLRQMLTIAIPLFPNFLIYWIFNSSDKLMITNIINTAASGIYSVGAKLGHCSQLIYTAFAGGWQYFAFSTMKEENQVKSNSTIFEYLGVITFVPSLFVFALSHHIFKIIFTGDYVQGYAVAPYLFMAPLLQMLFQVASNQFVVIKKTWPNMFILMGGAIVNIILNLFLIPKVGIEGAAIASLIGYVCANVVCCIVLIKMRLMTISNRFVFLTCMVSIAIVIKRCLFANDAIVGIVISILYSLCAAWFYRDELRFILNRIKRTKA